jgi:squalene monooxygenase
VLLLERDLAQPDRIVGELLQPGGYLKLKELGLDGCVAGIDAQAVRGYALFKGGARATIAYPTAGFAGDVSGRSFHNGRFVQRLRAAAAATPGVTVRAGTVRRLVDTAGGPWAEDGSAGAVGGVCYKAAADGAERTAPARLTVACDGMYSNLRSRLSTPSIASPSSFVGLILRGAALPAPSHGHVVLGAPAPVLFYPISSTEVRCLVDVPAGATSSGQDAVSVAAGAGLAKEAAQAGLDAVTAARPPGRPPLSALEAYLAAVVHPQIPADLRAPFAAALAAGGARSMPNKLMPARPIHTPGALLLGDAFNMRHPLTGGGMTVALGDVSLLTSLLAALPDFGDPAATALATAGFYTARKPLAATINTLANALYAVFCAPPGGPPAHEAMRAACFDYLRLGGWASEGPIALLSGLRPRPSVLVAHFFAVAVFGVGRLLLPRPTCQGLKLSAALLAGAIGIIAPIIRGEGIRAVFFPWLAPGPPMVDAALLEKAFVVDGEKEGKDA